MTTRIDAGGSSSRSPSWARRVAAGAALLALVSLVVSIVAFSLNNPWAVLGLILEFAVLGLALWWLVTRTRGRSLAWLVCGLAAALIVLDVAILGIEDFPDVAVIALLAVIFVGSATAALRAPGAGD